MRADSFWQFPAPHVIPDEVLRAMHRPAIDIYSGELLGITDSLMRDLPMLFGTKGRAYIYISNGHGAWEGALTNVLSRGDKILVLESGRFAAGWGEFAARLGVEVEVLKAGWRRAVRPDEVEARLKKDTKGEIKAILVTQVDTASGVGNDIETIGKAIKAANHKALFMVDVVASLGCVPFQMDAWGVDVAVAGSQKGLMTPPGLGFAAANDRAREIHKTAGLRTPYWDWSSRDGEMHYNIYAGTAPMHLMFGLRQALNMLLEEKLENVFVRHQLLADAVRAAVGKWTEGQELTFNIEEPDERSNTVTTVLMKDPQQLKNFREFCNKKCNVIIGAGIGDLTGKAFRIAHMGHVNAPMILGVLGAAEVALQALNIPHGSGGTSAAIKSLGASVMA